MDEKFNIETLKWTIDLMKKNKESKRDYVTWDDYLNLSILNTFNSITIQGKPNV